MGEHELTRKKPSREQQHLLADLLANQKDLAAGLLRSSEGRARAKESWAKISRQLNALGGAQRNPKEWCKYWSDKKSYLKKEAGKLKRSATMTGGGTDPVRKLSELEEKFLDLCGKNFGQGDGTAVNPFPSVTPKSPQPEFHMRSPSPAQTIVSTGHSGIWADEELFPVSPGMVHHGRRRQCTLSRSPNAKTEVASHGQHHHTMLPSPITGHHSVPPLPITKTGQYQHGSNREPPSPHAEGHRAAVTDLGSGARWIGALEDERHWLRINETERVQLQRGRLHAEQERVALEQAQLVELQRHHEFLEAFMNNVSSMINDWSSILRSYLGVRVQCEDIIIEDHCE